MSVLATVVVVVEDVVVVDEVVEVELVVVVEAFVASAISSALARIASSSHVVSEESTMKKVPPNEDPARCSRSGWLLAKSLNPCFP